MLHVILGYVRQQWEAVAGEVPAACEVRAGCVMMACQACVGVWEGGERVWQLRAAAAQFSHLADLHAPTPICPVHTSPHVFQLSPHDFQQ